MSTEAPPTVSATEAVRRALCLAALIRRADYEIGPPPQFAQQHSADDIAKVVRRATEALNNWLKAENLWDALSPTERDLMAQPSGNIPEQQLINMSWRAEALAMINWTLGYLKQMPGFDREVSDSDKSVAMPIQKDVNSFVNAAHLRPGVEIHKARDLAEFWHWRARTYQIQRNPDKYALPPGVSLDEIVRSAAAKGHVDGLFVAIDEDFPALGKAYRDLTEEEWNLMISIVRERHYVLNWLCSPGAAWDDVTTDT